LLDTLPVAARLSWPLKITVTIEVDDVAVSSALETAVKDLAAEIQRVDDLVTDPQPIKTEVTT